MNVGRDSISGGGDVIRSAAAVGGVTWFGRRRMDIGVDVAMADDETSCRWRMECLWRIKSLVVRSLFGPPLTSWRWRMEWTVWDRRWTRSRGTKIHDRNYPDLLLIRYPDLFLFFNGEKMKGRQPPPALSESLVRRSTSAVAG